MFSGAGPHSATNDGSPSDRGGAAPSPSTPVSMAASESTVACGHNGHDIQGDNSTPSLQSAVSHKKRRGASAVGPDKNGRGLRQFSIRVCEKVESKGITTYNEVADELVAEFSNLNVNIDSPDHDPSMLHFDEKNIRRRVYDALNVLRAMGIISKDKKEIQWRGLPKTRVNDIEELKTEVIKRKDRIEMKKAYLKDLQEQYACVQNLVQRNEQLYGLGDEPSSGVVALPFTLVQTHRDACVEVELSGDSRSAHLDFNRTPFVLHDENFVMKAMGLCDNKESDCIEARVANRSECSSTPSNYCPQSLQPPGPRGVWVPNSHPTPGIYTKRRACQARTQ